MSYENFKNFANDSLEDIDNRRKSYLNKAKLAFFIGLIVFASSFFFIPDLAYYLDKSSVSLEDYQKTSEEAIKQGGELIKYELYILIVIAWFASVAFFIFSYRKGTSKIKVGRSYLTDRKYSLKEACFTGIFNYFGNFTIKKDQGVRLGIMRQSGLLPKYEEVVCEDKISGIHKNSKIEFSEAHLLKTISGDIKAVFNGMIASIDFSSSDLKLSNEFKGRTIAISKKRFELAKDKSIFMSEEDQTLEIEGLEDYIIISNNIEEAKKVIDPNIIAKAQQIRKAIIDSEDQITHSDEKLLNLSLRISSFFAELIMNIIVNLLAFASTLIHSIFTFRMPDFRLIWRDVLEKKDKDYETYFPSEDDEEITDCSNFLPEMALIKDKVFFSIPYDKDLFEPNSIFENPVIESDLKLIYELMNGFFEISDDIEEKTQTVQNNVN